jgi:hypothetical protein
MCVTPPAFKVAEPDPTAHPCAVILAGWDQLTDKNKAKVLPFLESLIELHLADQGDPAAIAAREARDKKSEEWWAAELAEENKEREKLNRTLERVHVAANCAYREVLVALEDRPEAKEALSVHSELSFYEEALQNKNYDLSRIRGLKTRLKNLTRIWFAKALAETPADEVEAVVQS